MSSNLGTMDSTLSSKMSAFQTNVRDAFTTIVSTIGDKLKSAATDASSKLGELETAFSNKLSAISTNVSSIFSTISTNVSTTFSGIVTTIKNNLSSASSEVSTGFGNMKKAVSDAMSGMSSAISSESGGWASTISNALQQVQNVLNGTRWNVPELKIPVKTPKFEVSGEWEFDDDGNVTEVPEIKVKWYRRAAELGALFTEPTIIGVGDAAQPEMLIGEDTLYNSIRRAVTESGGGLKQTINITAPQGLNASETARLVRNNSRQLLARMRGGV